MHIHILQYLKYTYAYTMYLHADSKYNFKSTIMQCSYWFMQSSTDVECVPVMKVMIQILYGYYTILDELGIKQNTGIRRSSELDCGVDFADPNQQDHQPS